jgi:hypothetical protein
VSVAVGSLNAVPVLASLSPSSVATGSGAFTLSLLGNGFAAGAQAFFDGTALDTTFVSSGLVQAAVPAYLVANDETAEIVLVNPPPGGGASAVVALSVATPVPVDAGSDAGDDASDGGNLPAAGTLGGPCRDPNIFPTQCDSGPPQLICTTRPDNVNLALCLLPAGQFCTKSEDCSGGLSCIPGSCNQNVCASTGVSTSQCSIPGLSLPALNTCASGYVCQHDLTGGLWQNAIPMCGGAYAPCIPQTIPAGGSCDIANLSSTTCAPGLRCLLNQDAGSGDPMDTCQ